MSDPGVSCFLFFSVFLTSIPPFFSSGLFSLGDWYVPRARSWSVTRHSIAVCIQEEREKKVLIFGGTACTRVLHYVLESREVEEQRERGRLKESRGRTRRVPLGWQGANLTSQSAKAIHHARALQ